MIKFFKKYHKWLGVIITIFILLFSVSGIVLNHRELFSNIDVSRNILPQEYSYNNWNNAAVKGTLQIDTNTVLIYGNIGIWKTDTAFSQFSDFNRGFPKGVDNKKICKLFKSSKGDLYAGTFFGLFKYDNHRWHKIEIPVDHKRITDILEKDNELLILTRNFLLKTNNNKDFELITLPEPENYTNKIGLFKTLWVIHSGEIYGTIGKLIVDAVGLIFIFLTITGVILFVNTYIHRKRKRAGLDVTRTKKTKRWNLKWHNKIGWITMALLIMTTVTGMFLRPPLLIAIANAKVNKIPFTELDNPNPWFDKLRRLLYDDENQRFILATLDGFYYSDDEFATKLKRYELQPPASVMGVNVFKKTNTNNYLIGSFEGLFEWNPEKETIFDYIDKVPYIKPEVAGPPIGKYLITGMTNSYKNKEVYFTYNVGAINQDKDFVEMPPIIQQQAMSLWNLMLEVHTARIYTPIFGQLYLLVIPLSGIIMLFILISGFVVWYRKHRKI